MGDKPASLREALAALQTKLPSVPKTKTANTGSFSYKYADLSDVTKALMPLMGELGLSFTAKPTFSGERFVLAYKLMHTNGDSEEGEYPLDMRGSPQQIGSAITYARRYALCAVTGLAADEDDDGHVATVAKTDKPRQPPRRGKNDPMMSEASRKKMFALWNELGYGGDENQQQRRTIATKLLRRNVESIGELTEAEAFVVITELEKRKQEAQP